MLAGKDNKQLADSKQNMLSCGNRQLEYPWSRANSIFPSTRKKGDLSHSH